MHINIHNIPIVRRVAASLTGALVALTIHSIYQDTTAAVLAYHRAAQKVEQVDTLTHEEKVARVREFAQVLKTQRTQVSQ